MASHGLLAALVPDAAVLEVDPLGLDQLLVLSPVDTVDVLLETLERSELLGAALYEALVLSLHPFLSFVHPEVLLEVGPGDEVLATDFALVGPLAGVSPLVSDEVAGLGIGE